MCDSTVRLSRCLQRSSFGEAERSTTLVKNSSMVLYFSIMSILDGHSASWFSRSHCFRPRFTVSSKIFQDEDQRCVKS